MQSRNYLKSFIKKTVSHTSHLPSKSKRALAKMHLVSDIFLIKNVLFSLAPVQRNETIELNSTGGPMVQEKCDSKCLNLLQKYEG